MEAKIFDRETMLDLVVNFIPLGIILFFIAVFVMVTPWGFDVRTSGVMLGLMIVPFVALAVLTYLSAKAIAGDEKTKPVYAQGQAGLEEAEPEHHGDDESVEGAVDADVAADTDDNDEKADDSDERNDVDGSDDAASDGDKDDTDAANANEEDADSETEKHDSDDTADADDDEQTDT